MSKVKEQQQSNASSGPGPLQQGTPKPERKPRKDGLPHPPEGMRYNRKGEIVAKIPPEMRGYYVVIGVSRRSGAPTIAGKFKSSMKAIAFCQDYANMLMDSYSVYSVNKMRLFRPMFPV